MADDVPDPHPDAEPETDPGGAPAPARVVADGGTPSYGIDTPPMVLAFVVLGVVAATIAVFAGGGGAPNAAIGPGVVAVLFFGVAVYMVVGSTRGKPALWQATLDGLELRGDEDALDLGCGRGLVTIELARRLPDGHVTGIDLWRSRHQSGNSRALAETNAAAAGVADRVEVLDGDMQELPFEDNQFDLVTASLALHHIPLAEGRTQAVAEIARVLRANGRVVIVDSAKTADYVRQLEAHDLDEVERSGLSWALYPPVRTVTARKLSKNARSARDRKQRR